MGSTNHPGVTMTADAAILEANLSNIEKGATGFRVLSIVFTVFTILMILLLAASLVGYAATEGEAAVVLVERAKDLFNNVVEYGLLAWLSRLASDAFRSIAALSRENQGLV